MKNRVTSLKVFGVALAFSAPLAAGITFGEGSGFIAENGATLNVGAYKTFTGGRFKNESGTIVGAFHGNGTRIESSAGLETSVVLEGGMVDFGSAITLSSGAACIVNDTTSALPILISSTLGTSGEVRGTSLTMTDAYIRIASQCYGYISLSGQLNSDIQLHAEVATVDDVLVPQFASAILQQDLHFGNGYGFHSAGLGGTDMVVFNGHAAYFGGVSPEPLAIAGMPNWYAANVFLIGDIEIQDNVTLTLTDYAEFKGNGRKIIFSNDAQMQSYGSEVTFIDCMLVGLGENSLSGSSRWYFCNTRLQSASDGTAITINGSAVPTGEAASVDVLDGTPTFFDAAIELDTDIRLTGTWTAGTDLVVNGHGHSIYVDGGVFDNNGSFVRFHNVSFTGVAADTFTGAGGWEFTGCRLDAAQGSVNLDAIVMPRTEATGIDIFGGDVLFQAGEITFHSDIAPAGTWEFFGQVSMNAGGYTLALNEGSLLLGGGASVAFRDGTIALLQADESHDSVIFSGEAPQLLLSHAHVTLAGDVDWSARAGLVNVGGPVVVVTGPYRWIMQAASMFSSKGTLWYDTLGNLPEANVGGLPEDETAQVRPLSSDRGALVSRTYTAESDLLMLREDLHLYPSVEGITPGSFMIFSGGSPIVFNGNGRSLVLAEPQAAGVLQPLVSAAGGTPVVLTNTCIDGYQQGVFAAVDEGSIVAFGNGCLLKLRKDGTHENALRETIYCGSAVGSEGEIITIDLNGHTIDMNDEGAAIVLRGTANTLRIANGRISNLSMSKIRAGAGCTLVFSNVDLVLDERWTWEDDATLTFEGTCRLLGFGSVFRFSAGVLVIASGATLVLTDGVTYDHDRPGAFSFVLTDSHATVVLCNAVFRRPDRDDEADALVISEGLLIVDGKSYLRPGNSSIRLGYQLRPEEGDPLITRLSIMFNPGASLVVDSDYTASAGQVFYDNSIVIP